MWDNIVMRPTLFAKLVTIQYTDAKFYYLKCRIYVNIITKSQTYKLKKIRDSIRANNENQRQHMAMKDNKKTLEKV